MANKVGTLIKEARTGAGFTQEQLAKKIKGISANDISLAERGEKELTQAVLKEIAKATGVTQSSLLEAAKSGTRKSSSSKSSSAKTASSKKTSAATSTADLNTQEKKLIRLFRKADKDTQTAVLNLLDASGKVNNSKTGDLIGSLLGSAVEKLLK